LGRSKPEYVRMFSLTQADLQLRIVDCAAGPASQLSTPSSPPKVTE